MRTLFIFFLNSLIIMLSVNQIVTAAVPVPTFGTATVDGNISEWDLTNDFFANMWRAGDSTKNNPSIDAKLYLRYDCDNEVLYALVLGETGPVLELPDDNFIKLGNSTKLVDGNDNNDGTPPDFAWIDLDSGEADGWEASTPLAKGAYNNLNVHAQVFSDDEAQTAAVDGRAIDLEVDCEPTAVTLTSFTATSTADEVLVEWETATEVDNAGFNIYRSKRSAGTYKKVNGKLIPAQGNGAYGASYSFEDTPGRGTFYYKLEDVDENGVSAMHGPVKVRVRSAEGEAKRRRR